MSGQSEAAACAKVVAIDGPQGTGKTLVTDRIIRTAGAYFRYLNIAKLSISALSLFAMRSIYYCCIAHCSYIIIGAASRHVLLCCLRNDFAAPARIAKARSQSAVCSVRWYAKVRTLRFTM
jgi:hypothetical protein